MRWLARLGNRPGVRADRAGKLRCEESQSGFSATMGSLRPDPRGPTVGGWTPSIQPLLRSRYCCFLSFILLPLMYLRAGHVIAIRIGQMRAKCIVQSLGLTLQ